MLLRAVHVLSSGRQEDAEGDQTDMTPDDPDGASDILQRMLQRLREVSVLLAEEPRRP